MCFAVTFFPEASFRQLSLLQSRSSIYSLLSTYVSVIFLCFITFFTLFACLVLPSSASSVIFLYGMS